MWAYISRRALRHIKALQNLNPSPPEALSLLRIPRYTAPQQALALRALTQRTKKKDLLLSIHLLLAMSIHAAVRGQDASGYVPGFCSRGLERVTYSPESKFQIGMRTEDTLYLPVLGSALYFSLRHAPAEVQGAPEN